MFIPLILLMMVEPASSPVTVPQRSVDAATEATVRDADSKLFTAAFQTCDMAALGPMIVDDLEFFHDKTGLSAKSGAELIAQLSRRCDGWRANNSPTVIRRAYAGRDSVHPIDGYGMLHQGEHGFYIVAPDGQQHLVETGRFAHIWRQTDTGLKLARVISFDHVGAQ
jgi:Domain of unknown function (DUF4440)